MTVVILGYLAGVYVQRRDIDSLRSEMNHRFDDLKDWIRSEVRRVEDRIERLEHPVSKA